MEKAINQRPWWLRIIGLGVFAVAVVSMTIAVAGAIALALFGSSALFLYEKAGELGGVPRKVLRLRE
jgi:hypothetical protein